jgi:hypothetical protein
MHHAPAYQDHINAVIKEVKNVEVISRSIGVKDIIAALQKFIIKIE